MFSRILRISRSINVGIRIYPRRSRKRRSLDFNALHIYDVRTFRHGPRVFNIFQNVFAFSYFPLMFSCFETFLVNLQNQKLIQGLKRFLIFKHNKIFCFVLREGFFCDITTTTTTTTTGLIRDFFRRYCQVAQVRQTI